MTTFTHMTPFVAHQEWGDGGAWFLFPFLWLAVLGLAGWLVVRRLSRRGPSPIDGATAILAERYARGELSAEEYRERLEELRRP